MRLLLRLLGLLMLLGGIGCIVARLWTEQPLSDRFAGTAWVLGIAGVITWGISGDDE